jgi:hypothetical protein
MEAIIEQEIRQRCKIGDWVRLKTGGSDQDFVSGRLDKMEVSGVVLTQAEAAWKADREGKHHAELEMTEFFVPYELIMQFSRAAP